MKSRSSLFLLLILVFLAVLFISRWKELKQNDAQTQLRNQGFDRRSGELQFTRHALCRMDCRHIGKDDIKEIMQFGEINYAKSDINDLPCPTYALQGRTSDGQRLRVIFAQCSKETKVVTCYDLDRDFECYCPGDEKKKGKR